MQFNGCRIGHLVVASAALAVPGRAHNFYMGALHVLTASPVSSIFMDWEQIQGHSAHMTMGLRGPLQCVYTIYG